jgi:chromate transporter
MRRAMAGINAAVVGILLAALYDPVWISAVHNGRDFALLVVALVLLAWWRVPSWAVVLLTAVLAWWFV